MAEAQREVDGSDEEGMVSGCVGLEFSANDDEDALEFLNAIGSVPLDRPVNVRTGMAFTGGAGFSHSVTTEQSVLGESCQRYKAKLNFQIPCLEEDPEAGDSQIFYGQRLFVSFLRSGSFPDGTVRQPNVLQQVPSPMEYLKDERRMLGGTARCTECEQLNRIRPHTKEERPVCSSCKGELKWIKLSPDTRSPGVKYGPTSRWMLG